MFVAAPVLFNAIALLPEVGTRAASINDDAFHWAFISRGVDAIEHGENVLEFWVPQMGLGFPQFLYYQHLPHVSVILLYEALFRSVDAYTLFNGVRYALLAGLPVTVFWALRRMDLSPMSAAVGAAASSVLSTPYLYGFDYNSYLWRGFGMYTQLWATHLSFVTLACVYRLIQRGTGHIAAILTLSALALSHILYAYMAIITMGVVLLVGISRANALARAARLAIVGTATAVITSYMWIPTIQSAGLYLDFSPYLERWKYDSFGAARVLEYFAKGQLFDEGRPGVLSALVVAGLLAAAALRTPAAITAIALFATWLVLFFGRPTLGPLAALFPLNDALYFHRFIGGVHLAAIVLIGIAGGYALDRARGTPARVAVSVLLIALLLPAFAERASYYATQTGWMRTTADAIDADADLRLVLTTLSALPPGRVFAGKNDDWGPQLNFGVPFRSTQVRHMLTFTGIPEASIPYSGPSLNADLLYDFDERRAELYDLFDARYVIAPTGRAMPAFLHTLQRTTRYTLYEAPTSGYAEYVAIASRRSAASQATLFPANRAWLASGDVAARRFIRWDYPSRADAPSTGSARGCERGGNLYEEIRPSRLEFVVECANDAALAIKVTYHPNWSVRVDGQLAETFMLSPSYLGVQLAAGRHSVVAEYRSTPGKAPLLAAGLLGLVGACVGGTLLDRRRGWWSR